MASKVLHNSANALPNKLKNKLSNKNIVKKAGKKWTSFNSEGKCL